MAIYSTNGTVHVYDELETIKDLEFKTKMENVILDFIISKNIDDMDKVCLLKELTDYIKAN